MVSLQVWLPLNGNLNNQGLSNINATNNGATVNASGKIGSCYQFGTAASDITIPKEAMTSFTTEASVCFWIKILTWNTSYATFFQAGPASTPWTSYIFGLLRNNANSTCCFTISNGSSASNASYLTPSLDLNIWYHISLIYKTGHCLIYINGQLHQDYATSIVPNFPNITTIKLGRCTNGSSYQTNCQMNDFRLYDHALSAKEVELISRGLVLHYPLNRDGFGQDNLLSRYVSPGGQAPGATATAGRTNYYGDYGIIIPATENADTYFRLFLKEQLVQNETYTISCNVSGLLNGSMYRFPLFAQGNTSMGLLELNHNGLCSLTFTMTYSTQSAATIGNETVYICFMDDNGRTLTTGQGPITVTNFKIEKGSVATPWIPASTDALYSSLGLNSNIIYDASGYGNNGTKNGQFSYVSNTPRMCMSTEFNGSDNAIIIPFNNILGTSQRDYTISVWIYKTSIGSKSYQTILGGPSGFELEARNAAGTDPVFVGWNWGKPTAPYEFNKWTLFTFVHTTTDCKIYVNGQYVSTGSSKSNPSGNYYIGAWNSTTGQNYQGLMSDFRIYCTALTAEQIKELYDTSASLANNGTLLSYEFVEGGA